MSFALAPHLQAKFDPRNSLEELTPEMQTLSREIRADLERVLDKVGLGHLDGEYLTAAAIGIAREMGDHMLKRRPVDAAGAAEFATKLMLAGVETLAKSER